MDIRLVAIDMDGTFLDDTCSVPLRNMEAVKKAIEKGVMIVPTTGRSYWNTKQTVFNGVEGIPYYITANGSVIVDAQKETIVYSKTMAEESATAAYQLAKKYSTYIEVYAGIHAYMDDAGVENLYRSGVDTSYCNQLIGTNIRKDNLDSIILEEKLPISKYHIVCINVEEKVKLKEEIAALENMNPISVFSKNIELVSGTWSKREGLEKLTAKLGINKEQVLVIGDSNNDYEMMEWADHAVAMGNAIERIKEAASYITSTNNEAGVAQALEKYLDI